MYKHCLLFLSSISQRYTIHVPTYVNMPYNYAYMQLKYVNMQLFYGNMRHNYVCMHIIKSHTIISHVDMLKCCMFT